MNAGFCFESAGCWGFTSVNPTCRSLPTVDPFLEQRRQKACLFCQLSHCFLIFYVTSALHALPLTLTLYADTFPNLSLLSNSCHFDLTRHSSLLRILDAQLQKKLKIRQLPGCVEKKTQLDRALHIINNHPNNKVPDCSHTFCLSLTFGKLLRHVVSSSQHGTIYVVIISYNYNRLQAKGYSCPTVVMPNSMSLHLVIISIIVSDKLGICTSL